MAPKVKLNSAGVRELLADAGVRAELARLAGAVARRAGADAHVETATSGGYRQVARVVDDKPGALAREAHSGALARALDGGR